MQRYQLVLGGTVASVAGVLAFPTHSAKLTIPSVSASGTASSPGASGSTATGSSSAGSAAAGSAATGSGTTATGSGTTATGSASSSASSGTKSATSGDVQFHYGDMTVKVTVTGSRISNVSIASINETDGRSASIDSYAIPQLEQQVVAANSVNINGVSGATFTSQGFVDAVANALQKLGFKG